MQNISAKWSVLCSKTALIAAKYAFFCLILALLSTAAAFGQADESQSNSFPGAGKLLVHSKFGGQIFGFDIDQNGTEGLLSEAKTLSNGDVLAAVETFDQKTGKILKVVTKTETQDDFVTLGIVGASVGLILHEHEVSFLRHVKRTFHTLNPLDSNQFTGLWTPPIGSKHLIMPTGVSRSQVFRMSPFLPTITADNSSPGYSARTSGRTRSVQW